LGHHRTGGGRRNRPRPDHLVGGAARGPKRTDYPARDRTRLGTRRVVRTARVVSSFSGSNRVLLMKCQQRIVFGVVFLVLAGTPANAQDKKAPNYYPLQVGNQWQYQFQSGTKTGTAILRIAKIETIDEVPLALLEALVQDKVVGTEHLRQTDQGVF